MNCLILLEKVYSMQNPNVFIVSRRSWQQDDLEYGTFKIIYVSLKEYAARKLFRELKKMAITSENNYYKDEGDAFEYQRNNWFYQYKIEGFVQDQMRVNTEN